MPIALPLATVAAAGIGAAASSSAASKAAKASQNAANQNNALQTQIYNQNTANETPFMQGGQKAGATYNALLGLGGDANAAQNAFNTFQGSDGYQFRLGQGEQAVTQNKAVNGLLGSGSALKALTNYGQGAASQEFGNYLGYLGNQQQTGLSAANALAGVGTGYANAVSANNNNAANQTGNAALVGANNVNGLLGNGLSAYANYAGLQNQSSYGGNPNNLGGAPSQYGY